MTTPNAAPPMLNAAELLPQKDKGHPKPLSNLRLYGMLQLQS